MKISAVIPVYNRKQFIRRAVDSVLKQTNPVWEIIVVDDGSNDGTSKILKSYGDCIKVIRQDNMGVSAARNAGIKVSGGDWIGLLDSDDEWLPDKIAKAKTFHESNPQIKIFQTEEIWIRNGRRVNPKQKHQKHDGWIFKQSLSLCIVSPSAAVIEKKLFDEIGLFDESFPVCEDYDLWLRAARYYPIGLDREAGIIKYGGHDDQLSRKYWGMDHYRIMAMEKHLNDPKLPDRERRWVLEEIVNKLKILINGARKRGKDVSEQKEKLNKYRKSL
jgi:glycosyltransferase involved in cell wall biosynthesis